MAVILIFIEVADINDYLLFMVMSISGSNIQHYDVVFYRRKKVPSSLYTDN